MRRAAGPRGRVGQRRASERVLRGWAAAAVAGGCAGRAGGAPPDSGRGGDRHDTLPQRQLPPGTGAGQHAERVLLHDHCLTLQDSVIVMSPDLVSLV